MIRDMTTGKPMRLIVSFCLPVLAGNLFQQFYNMVDSVIVGQYVGKGAFAAVGSTGSLFFMVIGFVSGLCCGFSIIISKRFGAGDFDGMRKALANIIYLTVTISVLLTAGVTLATRRVLVLMNTPEDIFDDAYSYIIIIFAGIPVIMFYNLLACLLRAVGNSRAPLYFLIFSSLLNVGLDLLLVLTFNMGVKGVGIATVVSQLVSGILCLVYIRRKVYIFYIRRSDAAPNTRLCGELIHSGFPMALQFSITALGSIMLQTAVNSLGSNVVAAVTAAGKIQLMFIQPFEAMGATMATYCGQNLGACKLGRIKTGIRRTLMITAIYSVIAVIIVNLFGSTLALLFIKKEETALFPLIARFLQYNAWFYPALGTLFIYRNALQGMGYSMLAMLAGVFELVARGAFGIFFVPAFGFTAVCFANSSAWVAACVLLVPAFYWAFSHEKKKNGDRVNLTQPPSAKETNRTAQSV